MNNSSQRTIYQVSELTRQIQQMLEASYRSVWVEAEISSLSKPASGHLYFSLKDANSQIRCAMFRGRASKNVFQASEGDLVRVRGKVTVYAARGDMQMIIEHMEPAGEGLLQKQFEELKAKLLEEGLFAQQLKKSLPKVPRSISLITSPTGAAVQDVLTTLKRRFPSIPIYIYPTIVQGNDAPAQIVSALALANLQANKRLNLIQLKQFDGDKKTNTEGYSQTNGLDIIIVTRGGGSLEDLWCFNDESVVRAIVESQLPVISAIGHEVDITLCDFAADLRAATPTAAAELAVPDAQEFQNQLNQLKNRIELSKDRYFSHLNQNIEWLAKRITHPTAYIRQYKQRLSQLQSSLILNGKRNIDTKKQMTKIINSRLQQIKFKQILQDKKQNLENQSMLLRKSIQRTLFDNAVKLRHISAQLSAVSYERTLDRGYAIVKDGSGNIISQSAKLLDSDLIEVIHADGTKHAVIKAIEEKI